MLSLEEFEKQTAIKTYTENDIVYILFRTKTKNCTYSQVYKSKEGDMQSYLKFYYPMYVKDILNATT